MSQREWKKKEEKTPTTPWKKKRGRVFRVVLTGGPCGGKTSALKYFEQELGKLGIPAYCVPEVPTLVINGGLKYPGLEGKDRLNAFESNVIQLQIAHETAFHKIASTYKTPAVLFFDRGLCDIEAYLPNKAWNNILEQNNWKKKNFLKRYDLVIHLKTAADGAEQFYTLSNNTARSESAELARELDKKTQECWASHPRCVVVGNETEFKTKLAKAFEPIVSLIQKPVSPPPTGSSSSSSLSSSSTSSTSSTSR